MARMESQQKHTRDNMRVLATIENDDNYRKLMYNKVIEILSQVDTMSIDLAEQLEAETAVIPTRRENGYIVIPLSPEYELERINFFQTPVASRHFAISWIKGHLMVTSFYLQG